MKAFQKNRERSSFRDPSGFVYYEEAQAYRQINLRYEDNYRLLIESSLYKHLTEKGFLVKHRELKQHLPPTAYKILKPEQIPFVSYPYEWCFSQLKDAALLTLEIQRIAMEHGMSLKDASAYNIQYISGKPILIDTLSFEKYYSDKPWVAYRQFCQHFLAPLALMSYIDLHIGSLSKNFIDGIPLDLTSRLLPTKSKINFGILTHIHLHAKSQKKFHNPQNSNKYQKFGEIQMLGILSSLKSTIASLNLPKQQTTWGEYYNNTNYTSPALKNKARIVDRLIKTVKPKKVWDAGANNAFFSRIASKEGIFTIASDIDPIAIENAYMESRKKRDTNLLPLVIDLANPSPGLGWMNDERKTFFSRCNFDLALCLAFIHHLVIGNNLPFSYVAELFSKTTKGLIIEFVPKEDTKVKHLLSSRDDIFDFYTQENFEQEFSKYFKILQKNKIKGSLRTIYLMTNDD